MGKRNPRETGFRLKNSSAGDFPLVKWGGGGGGGGWLSCTEKGSQSPDVFLEAFFTVCIACSANPLVVGW